jgi:hypothetical protein
VMLERIRRGFRDFATLDYPSEGEEIITWFDYYDSDDLDMWPETIAGLDRDRT